jgi:hypothetical protein
MLCPRRTVIILITITLLFNGCILERIFRVKKQFCAFEKYFKIEISDGFRVLLQEPVLLDEDVTWITGAEPSESKFIGGELVMKYVAVKRGTPSNGQFDLPVELRFGRIDDDFRLKEGYLSKNLTDILTHELLTQIMRSVCKSDKSLINQRLTIDISALNRSLLPSRSEILSTLGPPNQNPGNVHKLAYVYQLKNNDTVDKVAAIEIQFDRFGERIIRIKFKYLRYNLNADFDKGEAILKVDIFVDWEV